MGGPPIEPIYLINACIYRGMSLVRFHLINASIYRGMSLVRFLYSLYTSLMLAYVEV